MKIKYNKIEMFKLYKKEIKDNKDLKKNMIKELNVNKGTVSRWELKKEIPPQYFNEINRLLGNKYELDINEKDKYKINDQFFTPPEEAKRLIELTIDFITLNYNVDLSEYQLIEPSAGSGAFLNNFPKDLKKIGLDLEPQNKKIRKQNYFEFSTNKKSIVIGNPPFGLRGMLALKFINHSSKFADFVCFILPPLFNSNGKGTPGTRVKGYKLVKEINIDNNNFTYPDGEKAKVHSIFQIWTKLDSKKITPIELKKPISKYMRVVSLSDGGSPSSRRNVSLFDKCDIYLPSTTFQKIRSFDSFKELPHKRGYGVILDKKYKKHIQNIKDLDWNKISFKSTNSANNLRSQLIIEAIEKYLKKVV